jgi:hypothetical protein
MCAAVRYPFTGRTNRRVLKSFIRAIAWVAGLTQTQILFAQAPQSRLEIYGFIMLDGGYNFNTIDPDWFDVMRPTKLPSQAGQFAPSGKIFFSMRQTRFGIRSTTPTSLGQLRTRFDFDLFGFGDNLGQTTFHLINAYAELGKFGAGQTASVLMDQDVFPVTLDYWGPSSRTFFFNIQFRYTPIDNDRTRLAMALERPGASADGSNYRTHLDMEHVEPQFPLPNFTIHYRRKTAWGHAQAGALLKFMKWNDLNDTGPYSLSGQAVGWGFNASAALNVSDRLTLKGQAMYGKGIQNYVADGTTDVALQRNDGNPSTPAVGVPIPFAGFFTFAEYKWTEQWRSTIGYSLEQVDNTNLQRADAFRRGQYGLFNIRYYPVDNIQIGAEYQYGRRDNFDDGSYSNANKLQISFKINFSAHL